MTAIEALTGLFFIPLLSSLAWLYCTERLWSRSAMEQGQEGPTVQWDSAFGVFRDMPNTEQAKTDIIKRASALPLNPCQSCGETPAFDKFYDLIGWIEPVPRFSVACRCGRRTSLHFTAYRAAAKWNKQNRVS